MCTHNEEATQCWNGFTQYNGVPVGSIGRGAAIPTSATLCRGAFSSLRFPPVFARNKVNKSGEPLHKVSSEIVSDFSKFQHFAG